VKIVQALPTVILMAAKWPEDYRKPESNGFNADYSDFADEAFERSSPKSITKGLI
jgi:hypothetical protein